MSALATARSARPTFRPPWVLRHGPLLGWTVLIFSVAAHVGVAVLIHQRPMGHVDPALLEATRPVPVRVRRVTSPTTHHTSGQQGNAAQTTPLAPEAVTPENLSATLLTEAHLLPPAHSAHEPFAPALRPVEEALGNTTVAEQVTAQIQAQVTELPAFSLPENVLLDLPGQGPTDLSFTPGQADGVLAPPRTGAGSGNRTNTAGTARQLLAGQLPAPGLPPAPATNAGASGAAGSGRPGVSGALQLRPLAELTSPTDRPVDAALLAPPTDAVILDFTELALSDTTQLVVPEHLDNDFQYEVSRWEDPGTRRRDTRGEPGYFRVDISPLRSLHKLEAMPKDVIFLLDTSGSVPQIWVQKAVAGLRESLPALNPGDRFNIVLFSDQPSALSDDGPLPATAENIARAGTFLEGAASRGWTDVNAALRGLLARHLTGDRTTNLILISDGLPTRGVMDTRSLINLITRDNDLVSSIYCVGIGHRQNRELLDFLAYRNKGFSTFANHSDEVAPLLVDLLSRLRYPLIRDLRVSVAGVDGREVFPLDLPNIHQGERFQIFGRYQAAEPFTIHITGRSGGRPVDFTFTRDLADAAEGDREIGQQWAFWKLHHLYSEVIRQGEQPELLRQIDEIRRRYRLKTLY